MQRTEELKKITAKARRELDDHEYYMKAAIAYHSKNVTHYVQDVETKMAAEQADVQAGDHGLHAALQATWDVQPCIEAEYAM